MIKECIYALEQGEEYNWPEKFEVPEDLMENLTVKGVGIILIICFVRCH